MKNATLTILLTFIFGLTSILKAGDPKRDPKFGYSIQPDTTDTSYIQSNQLPFTPIYKGNRRPKFDTIHLVVGVGWMQTGLSDLNQLIQDSQNSYTPVSLYMRVPLRITSSHFDLIAGGDFGKYNSFKSALIYQTDFSLLLGLGAGRMNYTSDSNSLVINLKKTFGVAALGLNIIPNQLDLVAFFPLMSKISTDFEGRKYSVKFPGIHISLMLSLK